MQRSFSCSPSVPESSVTISVEVAKEIKNKSQQMSTVYAFEPETSCSSLFFILSRVCKFYSLFLWCWHDFHDHLRDMFKRKMTWSTAACGNRPRLSKACIWILFMIASFSETICSDTDKEMLLPRFPTP
jgi:hypothetical protein